MIDIDTTEARLFDRVHVSRNGDRFDVWLFQVDPDSGRTDPAARLILTGPQAARLGAELVNRATPEDV